MNVAVTRAKRLCVLIGDTYTVSGNKFLDSLCKHFKTHGQVRSAFDYEGNPDVRSMYGVKKPTVTASSQPKPLQKQETASNDNSNKLSKAEKKK